MDAVLPSSQTYYFDMPAQISIKIVAALISVQPHPAKSNALARYDVAKLEITQSGREYNRRKLCSMTLQILFLLFPLLARFAASQSINSDSKLPFNLVLQFAIYSLFSQMLGPGEPLRGHQLGLLHRGGGEHPQHLLRPP